MQVILKYLLIKFFDCVEGTNTPAMINIIIHRFLQGRSGLGLCVTERLPPVILAGVVIFKGLKFEGKNGHLKKTSVYTLYDKNARSHYRFLFLCV
jgi:hypothetical protein